MDRTSGKVLRKSYQCCLITGDEVGVMPFYLTAEANCLVSINSFNE